VNVNNNNNKNNNNNTGGGGGAARLVAVEVDSVTSSRDVTPATSTRGESR